MFKKKYLSLIIILIIFLIIFLTVFLLNLANNNNQEIYQEKEPPTIPYNMEKVNDYSQFFSVLNNVVTYLNYLKDHNTIVLNNLLNKEYIETFKIDQNNIYDYLGYFKEEYPLNFKIKNMYYQTYDNFNRYLYFINGDIIENDFAENKIIQEDTMFLVNVDYENITYSIYPLIYFEEDMPLKNPERKIDANPYNKLIGSNIISKDYICNLYLSDFIKNINNNPENTYDLLETNFRKKSYPKKNDYIKYINNNKDKFSTQIYACNLLSSQKRIYEIKDMNLNKYIFTEEDIMNYKVEFTLN